MVTLTFPWWFIAVLFVAWALGTVSAAFLEGFIGELRRRYGRDWWRAWRW